jgi:hypothetical protein
MKHHVWCNYQNPMFPENGAEDCTMCAGLRRNYPEDGKSPEDLRKEHFPNVKVVRE